MAEPCMISRDGGKTWEAFKPPARRKQRYHVQRDAAGKLVVVKRAGRL